MESPMAYVPLELRCSDERIRILIRDSIEAYLQEIHYLLAASYPAASPDKPSRHFARSAGLMLVATIGATSALSTFEKDGKRRSGDARYFKECVREYFPWGDITIKDGEHRPTSDRIAAAVEALYSVVRNPLVHSAGLVGKSDVAPRFIKLHARSPDLSESEPRIEEIARYASLDGQVVIEFRYKECRIYPDFLYWCVRKMVESYIADPKNEQAVLQHCTS
jgi:hypothetical protein